MVGRRTGVAAEPMVATTADSARPTTLHRPLVLGVAGIALCTLFFEVLLTRIFSVTLWYHFGFLAISLALLGTAASAVLCFLYPDFLAGERHLRNMAASAALFAAAAPASVVYHVAVAIPGFGTPLAFYLVFGSQLALLFLSFFFAGLCISIALFRYADRIGAVYCSDLVGAALGAVVVVPLMYRWSPFALIFVVSAVALAAALGFLRSDSGPRHAQLLLLLGIAGSLGVALGNDAWDLVSVNSVKSYVRSQIQEKEGEKLFERWSPVSRVTVRVAPPELGIGPQLIATTDGGAPTPLPKFSGDYATARSELERDPNLAAFQLKTGAQVLVIGVGGGRDVLAALSTGQRSVTAVEINPVMGQLVTEEYADHIGRIFEDPRVGLHIQEGRNFVAGSQERFDLIVFSMIDSWSSAAAAGAYVFNENSLYTIEAIGDFVEHLAPGGILSMTRYYEWDEGLRLATMFAEYLAQQGVDDPARRIMVVRTQRQRPTATVLLKNGPFTPQEATQFREIALRTHSQILHAPHLPESELAPAELRAAYAAVLTPEGGRRKDRLRYIRRYPRDITPPTDDRPFFFYTQLPLEVFSPNPGDHAARRLALPLLYAMMMALGTIALLTIFFPLYLRAGGEIRNAPHRTRSLVYFSMLGTGFMLIEISLIQRLTIFLGHPTWSFVVVLATILLSSGLGSLTTGRWPEPRPRVLRNVLAGIVILVLFCALVVYDQFIELMWLGRTARIALAVVTIAPLGFLMGMCFPLGVQIVRRFHPTLVPWGWGVNGAFSVFASVFSIVIALVAGFKAAILIGIACYAIAFGLISGLASEARPGSEA